MKVQKAEKLLMNKFGQLKDKEELYIMRYNSLIQQSIFELQNNAFKHGEKLKNNINLDSYQSSTPHKGPENLQAEILHNSQIIIDHKKQLQHIESRRARLLDFKYRQDIDDEISGLRASIKDLKMQDHVKKEIFKGNLAIKVLKEGKLVIEEDGSNISQGPKSEAITTSSLRSPKHLQLSLQIMQNQKQILSNKSEHHDKKESIIEKSILVSEKLDIILLRNERLNDNLVILRDLIKMLKLKGGGVHSQIQFKVNSKQYRAKQQSIGNQIYEQPGMELRHKQLIQRIAALEKSQLNNQRTYEIELDQIFIPNQQVNATSHYQLLQICEQRVDICTSKQQEILGLRAKIDDLVAVQEGSKRNQTFDQVQHSNNKIISLHESKNNNSPIKNQKRTRVSSEIGQGLYKQTHFIKQSFKPQRTEMEESLVVKSQKKIYESSRVQQQQFDYLNQKEWDVIAESNKESEKKSQVSFINKSTSLGIVTFKKAQSDTIKLDQISKCQLRQSKQFASKLNLAQPEQIQQGKVEQVQDGIKRNKLEQFKFDQAKDFRGKSDQVIQEQQKSNQISYEKVEQVQIKQVKLRQNKYQKEAEIEQNYSNSPQSIYCNTLQDNDQYNEGQNSKPSLVGLYFDKITLSVLNNYDDLIAGKERLKIKTSNLPIEDQVVEYTWGNSINSINESEQIKNNSPKSAYQDFDQNGKEKEVLTWGTAAVDPDQELQLSQFESETPILADTNKVDQYQLQKKKTYEYLKYLENKAHDKVQQNQLDQEQNQKKLSKVRQLLIKYKDQESNFLEDQIFDQNSFSTKIIAKQPYEVIYDKIVAQNDQIILKWLQKLPDDKHIAKYQDYKFLTKKLDQWMCKNK